MVKCDLLRKLLRNFIEIALWHGCSLVNWLHIFRTPFSRNASGWLLLNISFEIFEPALYGVAFVPACKIT